LHFFLNGRWFSDRLLVQAVMDAYGELLPRGRYPVGVLNLEIDPALVDVNVHPAKSVVRFADEKKVFGAVLETVREALSTAAVQPHGMPGRPLEPLPFKPRVPPKVEVRPVQKTIYGVEAARPASSPEPEKGLPEVTILGQAHGLYILGQTKDGLVIIDQHAAHERINYERLSDEFSGGKVRSQTLLAPRTLELTARQKRAFESGAGLVQRIGYDVEDFGGRSCVVKAVPVVGGQALSPESLKEVIDELLEAAGKPGSISEAGQDRLLKLMACHSSIRAGERLEMEQMRALVEAL